MPFFSTSPKLIHKKWKLIVEKRSATTTIVMTKHCVENWSSGEFNFVTFYVSL